MDPCRTPRDQGGKGCQSGAGSNRRLNLTDINYLFIILVIQSFADAETERFYTTGKSRRFPLAIQARAAIRLTQLDSAIGVEDLRVPPSNKLQALQHDRVGYWSIRINDQWRLCFRFMNGDAFDVEIVDYH